MLYDPASVRDEATQVPFTVMVKRSFEPKRGTGYEIPGGARNEAIVDKLPVVGRGCL